MGLTLLIDGDIVLYRAAAAVNRSFTFDGDNYVSTGSLEQAKIIVEDALASLLKAFRTDRYIVALTDPANWRNAVYPPYKQNRKDKERPVCLAAIREHMAQAHPVYQRPTLEADDVLGILATSNRIIPGDKIVVSADKDLKTVPGVFHDMNSGDTLEIPEAEADYHHMRQTLTGDRTDGYPGCPKVGPVKADRILEQGTSVATWWPLVAAAYEKAGRTGADALAQARVARICRASDYDFKKKEVRLWTP